MRIVMLGTGPFAVPTFRSLLQSSHDVRLLVTRPPRGGRGKNQPPPSPMWLVAHDVGLPIDMPASINSPESIQRLEAQRADLLVVCDYGQILSREALSTARCGGINLHASLLPAYRGAAPIHWAVYDGCVETGVTVIHMTPRLDAGPSLVQVRVAIGADETADGLESRLAEIGAAAVHQAIEILDRWDGQGSVGVTQDPAAATKAPRLQRNDGDVDWTRSAAQIANQVRAFQPWPGTFTHWLRPDQVPLRVILNQVSVVEHSPVSVPSAAAGTVVGTEQGLDVATGNSVLRILSIQPAGRNLQSWEAFLRGYRIAMGDQFGRT